MNKLYYILIIFFSFGFTEDENTSIKDEVKMYHLYIPDRDLRAKDRLMKPEQKKISSIYSKGDVNTYRLIINKNEVHEDIFTLEHFIGNPSDIRDAARHYKSYNHELFLIYHNQNGFFPIHGNEYYLINESKSSIYEIIPDGQIHYLKAPDDAKYNKIVDVLCKYKNRIYTIPHEMCK